MQFKGRHQKRPNGHSAIWQRTALTWLAGTLALLAPALGMAQVYTIGSSVDCDLTVIGGSSGGNLIQAAIDDGHRDIRVERDLQLLTAVIHAVDVPTLRISGGYASCADADNAVVSDPDARTRLEANGGIAFALLNANPGFSRTVILDRLDIRQSSPQPSPDAASAVTVSHLNFHFRNGRIHDFIGDSGGAIAATLSGVTLRNAVIDNNHAAFGGGIDCDDSAVVLDAQTRVQGNVALQSGGGIAGRNDCTLIIESRPDEPGGQLADGGILGNMADLAGGGIHLQDGLLRIEGGPFCEHSRTGACPATLARLQNNSALHRGGAVSLEGNARALIRFSEFVDNHSPRGGAIWVGPSAQLVVGRDAEAAVVNDFIELPPAGQRQGCEQQPCQRFVDNGIQVPVLLRDDRGGGAIRVDGGQARISDSLLANNLADAGNAVMVSDGGTLRVEQSLAIQDSDNPAFGDSWSLMHARAGELDILQSTLFKSTPWFSDLGLGSPVLLVGEGVGSIELRRSVVLGASAWETHVQSEPGTVAGGCNLINQQAEVEFQTSRVDQAAALNTLFAADDSWTPDTDGALVDRCLPAPAGPLRDLYGHARSVALSPTFTLQDVGAVEAQASSIFADGFEDGAAP